MLKDININMGNSDYHRAIRTLADAEGFLLRCVLSHKIQQKYNVPTSVIKMHEKQALLYTANVTFTAAEILETTAKQSSTVELCRSRRVMELKKAIHQLQTNHGMTSDEIKTAMGVKNLDMAR